MDFYEPTFLFRQNAIRRPSSPKSLPNSLSESLPSSWLLHNNSSDTQLTQKTCSLDRLNIKSNYWKIPDCDMNLTALAASDPASDNPLVAISSANTDSNLFIYELDTLHHYLTHHTTISLPNIHGLAWVPGHNLRFLISGNNKGYAHLVLVPLPATRGGSEDESAEIVKRFNHRKHLRSANKDPALASHRTTCVSKLGFSGPDSLVSIYDDTLFVWNMNDCTTALRPRPLLISVIPGIRNFDVNPLDPATLAICGSFGPSLYDTRCATYSVPSQLRPQVPARRNALLAGIVKWHPTNEHVMAVAHDDGVVRLWDIRKNETFSEISGHRGKQVTTMAWNHGDLFTGASDGNIVHWDLTSGIGGALDLAGEALLQCTLKEGIDSVSFDATSNTIVDRLHERQCGTMLPALNNRIVAMCQTGASPTSAADCNILSIDTLAFLGLHSKIYDAVTMATEKHYYSKEDLLLIAHTEGSVSTLIGLSESLVKPLAVRKREPLPDAHDVLDTDTIHSGDGVHSGDEVHSTAHKNPTHDLVAQPKEPVDTTEVFSDLDFSARDDSRLFVPSLHSVESLPGYSSSLYLGTDSVYSLSTLETFVGAPVDDKALMAFLDSELDRICAAFQGEVAAI